MCNMSRGSQQRPWQYGHKPHLKAAFRVCHLHFTPKWRCTLRLFPSWGLFHPGLANSAGLSVQRASEARGNQPLSTCLSQRSPPAPDTTFQLSLTSGPCVHTWLWGLHLAPIAMGFESLIRTCDSA